MFLNNTLNDFKKRNTCFNEHFFQETKYFQSLILKLTSEISQLADN